MKAKKRVKVIVWVCRECGNYYASSNAGDLSTLMNTDRATKKPTFPRSRCPTTGVRRQGS